MAKRKNEVVLSEEQKRKNKVIFARLEADRQKLFEETRHLQANWRQRRAERLAKYRKAGKERMVQE